jgi:hypothetical protein
MNACMILSGGGGVIPPPSEEGIETILKVLV